MPVGDHPATLRIQDLGLISYTPCLALQRQIHQQVLDHHSPPTLLLAEHPPVITISQRPSARNHLLADEHHLAQLGVDLQPTDRGGDITYHGPGQLVAYPILRLAPLGLNVGRYMRLLEQIIIDTLAAFDIRAFSRPGLTGVWVELPQFNKGEVPTPAKIAALGVRVRRNVTLHGLALNVHPHMDHFRLIIPCGLQGTHVTSMRDILGSSCPNISDVRQKLITVLLDHLDRFGQPHHAHRQTPARTTATQTG